MSFLKIFSVATVLLFGGIGAIAYAKKQKKEVPPAATSVESKTELPIEIPLAALQIQTLSAVEPQVEKPQIAQAAVEPKVEPKIELQATSVDRVEELFRKGSTLPIVETITYKSRVPWKSGRPAWLIDYASHYKTPIDFIARSINESPNYTPPSVNDGVQFAVLSKNVPFHFLLAVDIKKRIMNLSAVLPQKNEKIDLKTYSVCLGRPDASKASGYLTPRGKYTLGSRILTIKPKQMGNYKGDRVELIRVFGTRWIPFEKEMGTCTEPAKGFGIHGTPWSIDPNTGALADNTSSIGTYESDGCIRLKRNDMEELYAIISSRETVIEIN
jgi:hypothetical protein